MAQHSGVLETDGSRFNLTFLSEGDRLRQPEPGLRFESEPIPTRLSVRSPIEVDTDGAARLHPLLICVAS
jgi:hypothetical protein